MKDKGTREPDDDLLMARAGHGDEQAFALLVQRHLPRALALATRMLGPGSDAEDSVQEAFTKLWITAPEWQQQAKGGKARPGTWLHTVVRNGCIDRLRKHRFTGLDETQEPESPADNAETLLAREADRKAVRAAIAQLPENQQTALDLCFFDGHSNRDAAVMMGLSVGAVESLLVRARRRLKSLLADPGPELTERA